MAATCGGRPHGSGRLAAARVHFPMLVIETVQIWAGGRGARTARPLHVVGRSSRTLFLGGRHKGAIDQSRGQPGKTVGRSCCCTPAHSDANPAWPATQGPHS